MRNTVIAVILILLVATGVYWFTRSQNTKTGYIVTSKLFDSYNGTKDLSRKVQDQQNKYKLTMDSLKLDITMRSSGPMDASKQKELDKLKANYNALAKEVLRYNEEFVENEQSKLWMQLNQHVKTFGEEKNYTFIYGANGTGNVMYADSSLNITTEVLEFANAKYDGK